MIFLQLKEQLNSLSHLLSVMDNDQYTRKLDYLSSSSIGAHTRHIIELLQCVIIGYTFNKVDYHNRIRNLLLENDKKAACVEIEILLQSIDKPDRKIELEMEFNVDAFHTKVYSTYFREIVYNTEHTIHHLALIKVGLHEMQLKLVDDTFGMAYSTIQYKSSLTNK